MLSDVLTHFIYRHYILALLVCWELLTGVKLWFKVPNGGTTSNNWIEVGFFLVLHIILYSTCWNWVDFCSHTYFLWFTLGHKEFFPCNRRRIEKGCLMNITWMPYHLMIGLISEIPSMKYNNLYMNIVFPLQCCICIENIFFSGRINVTAERVLVFQNPSSRTRSKSQSTTNVIILISGKHNNTCGNIYDRSLTHGICLHPRV